MGTTAEIESASSKAESYGMVRTSTRITTSDPSKEIALLERIVLPRLHVGPQISLRNGRWCAA